VSGTQVVVDDRQPDRGVAASPGLGERRFEKTPTQTLPLRAGIDRDIQKAQARLGICGQNPGRARDGLE
jgi:hypothetical protein